MIINLKQIRVLDTDNIKLDKINYNFDQLIVNGGGPKGYIGPNGNAGPQGFQGALGVQGDRGFQGVQGSSAASAVAYWLALPQNFITGSNMTTLFSKHPITSPSPPYATVVSAGYTNVESGYNNPFPHSGLPKYQWVVNRRSDKVASNLRFVSEDVKDNSFNITMDNSIPQGLTSPEYRLHLGFIDNSNSQLNLLAEKHVIGSLSNLELLTFSSSTGGSSNKDTFFEGPVKFNAALVIGNQGADVNKIVTAIDATGAVTFKTTEELGGSVKVGTIISILPSIFKDPNKFVINQNINTVTNPNVPIQIRIGAGVGDYLGWYVCNGQTWTNNGVSFLVPDLNSFSYQIVANPITPHPNSQGSVNVTNDEIQLIGGAQIYINATIPQNSSSNQYTVSTANNSSDPLASTNNSGVQYRIKKLPQIIYLGAGNLSWSQLGDGQSVVGDYSSSDYEPTDYNSF